MDRIGNQVTHPVEHRAVPGEPGQARELLGHDQQRKVPAACRGAGMPSMLGAVVGEFEQRPVTSDDRRSAEGGRRPAVTAAPRSRGAASTESLHHREQQEQADAAPHLEVHPRLGGEVEGDVPVEQPPSRRRTRPMTRSRRDHTAGGSTMSFSRYAMQVAAESELADREHRAERAIQHGGLPLDEHLVLQDQRGPAEHDDDARATASARPTPCPST